MLITMEDYGNKLEMSGSRAAGPGLWVALVLSLGFFVCLWAVPVLSLGGKIESIPEF